MARSEGKPQQNQLAVAPQTQSALDVRTPPGNMRTFGQLLDKNKGRLSIAARDFMPGDEMIILAKKAASRNPELLECTGESIIRALMDAAQLRIRPNHTMGRGYLIPRRRKIRRPEGDVYVKECQFDPGYRGLLDVARRGGSLKSLSVHVVYQCEIASGSFRIRFGSNEGIDHDPTPMLTTPVRDRGEIVLAYAVARLSDGAEQVEVMDKDELDKIRKMAAGGGPWSTWYAEMARKSVLRRLCKFLPYTDEMEAALEAAGGDDVEDVVEDVVVAEAVEVEEPEVVERQPGEDGPDLEV